MLSTWALKLDKRLAGQPDELLTIALIGVALAAGVVALAGTPVVKAAVLAWVLFP